MNAHRRFLQPDGAVIDGVHRSQYGQKHLRRTNIGSGFFATNVLFARLQSHAKSGLALRIDGESDNAAGHISFKFFAGGKKSRVRAAVSYRHSEALRIPDDG